MQVYTTLLLKVTKNVKIYHMNNLLVIWRAESIKLPSLGVNKVSIKIETGVDIAGLVAEYLLAKARKAI